MNISVNTAAISSQANYTAKKAEENVIPFIITETSAAKRPAIRVKNDADAVSVMEQMTGKAAANEPSCSVTDEEAEYFREKYGETYDEDKVCELYDELEKKGITDPNYFSYASGYIWVMPLDGLKVRGFMGIPGYDPYNLGRYCGNGGINFTGDKVFIKDVSRTDENAYKYEWEKFKSEYDNEILTWSDKLQESIDFERYLKDTGRKRYPSEESFNKWIEGLKKTKDVIERIFTENT